MKHFYPLRAFNEEVAATYDDSPRGDEEETVAFLATLAQGGPALELADIDPPPEDPERILAGNIYQRGVALGRPAERRSLTGATARVVVNGEPRLVDDPEEPTGPLIGLLRHVADLLGAFGERLRAGEVVICGAVVPPVPIAPGDRVEYELHPLGALSLSFRD